MTDEQKYASIAAAQQDADYARALWKLSNEVNDPSAISILQNTAAQIKYDNKKNLANMATLITNFLRDAS